MYDAVVENILGVSDKATLKNVFLEAYENKRCVKRCGKDLNILILSTPCNGFGDIMFAMKFATYVKDWYGANVMIASTSPESFVTLGASKKSLLKLDGGANSQCRRFKFLKFTTLTGAQVKQKYDLIFVAPLTADYDIIYSDIRAILPYSTLFNTFYLSEYNDTNRKNFDFPTGVGKHNMGLLFTDTKNLHKPANLKNPYSFIYIAWQIPRYMSCMYGFIEMVAKKYKSKHPKLDIVIPAWLVDEIEDYEDKVVKILLPYYSTIRYIDAEGTMFEYITSKANNNILTFRGDILPVNNKKMLGLLRHSIDDILLTGDQSITDALSCCPKKNIFYQIAPWKEDFGQQLAKHLPNKFLVSKKTSCGTLKAINYTSNYSSFVKKWDFRKLAKPKLDAIIQSTIGVLSDMQLQELQITILNSKTLNGLKNKLDV
jgi:hypothetical protein